MTDSIMQCCYTNAEQEVGGKISSGWQAVAVTNNIPSDAYNGCIKLQNANSTIQSHMVDERGNILNLFEITGDGSYAYVSRTQYGLVDRLGRPNMFSHAYIFSWKQEEVIADPNLILTLDRCNFADNEETAKQEKISLVRREPFSLFEALQISGMNEKTYLTLIQCVYLQYSERKSAKPLYVKYDGTDEQMQAILYCVYYGIPYYMRRNLAISSAVSNSSESKNLIFSEHAEKFETYIIPQTGENNILTPRAVRKIARYGFVDFVAQNYSTHDISRYHAQLERTAIELGDPTASNELILKIAHLLIAKTKLVELSDGELDSRLSDALRSKSYGSQRMDLYISEMLDEVCVRKLFLSEENEATLAERLSTSATDELVSSGEQYNIYRFSTLEIEEAAKMLSNMVGPSLSRYCQALSNSPKGLQILDYYYAEYSLTDGEVTWERLSELFDQTSFMVSRRKTVDAIDAKAWELYYSLLDKGENISFAYNSLMELMELLYGKGNRYRYEQSAREAYWEKKDFGSFAYNELDTYKLMSISSVKCKMFAHMYAVVDAYKLKGEEEFLVTLNAFFLLFRNQIAQDKLSGIILSAIEKAVKGVSSTSIGLYNWMKIASIADAQELFEEIMKARNMLKSRQFDKFVEVHRNIVQVSSFSRNSGSLRAILGESLLEECKRMDCAQEPIPLDVWLVLGSSQYANAFRIFDVTSPRPYILDQHETFVVIPSKLLSVHPYSLYAEDYILDKGAEAKTVKKWISEQKNVEKRRRMDERRVKPDPYDQGIDHGRSRKPQVTSVLDSKKPSDLQDTDIVRNNLHKGFKESAIDKNPPINNSMDLERSSEKEVASPSDVPVGNVLIQSASGKKKQEEKNSGLKGLLGLFGRK